LANFGGLQRQGGGYWGLPTGTEIHILGTGPKILVFDEAVGIFSATPWSSPGLNDPFSFTEEAIWSTLG
jgi:hypothetical protein